MTIEKYLTPEQIQRLQAAREANTGAMDSFQENMAALRRLRDAGKGPDDPEVQAIARHHRKAGKRIAGADPALLAFLSEAMDMAEPGR